MSFGDQPSPYQPPSQPTGQAGAPVKPATSKPGSLVAVSIVTLILGIIFSAFGCCATFGLFFTAEGTEFMVGMMEQAAEGAGDEAVTNATIEATKAGMEATQESLVIQGVVSGLGLLASIMMVIGGILGLTKSPLGKPILIVTFLACIGTNLLSFVVAQFIVTPKQIAAQEAVWDQAIKDIEASAGEDATEEEKTQASQTARVLREAADSTSGSSMIGLVFGIIIVIIFDGLYIALLLVVATSKSISNYYAALRS